MGVVADAPEVALELFEGGVLGVAGGEIGYVGEKRRLGDAREKGEGVFVEGEDGRVPVAGEDGGKVIEGVGVLGMVSRRVMPTYPW